MWGYGYNMMGVGWGWLMGSVILILLVLAVIVILRVVPRHAGEASASTHPNHGASPTPRQILDERYARGDITTEEFRERLQNLDSA
jgi:putative membrane protein